MFKGSNWTGRTNRTMWDAFGYEDNYAFKDKPKYTKYWVSVGVFVYFFLLISMFVF